MPYKLSSQIVWDRMLLTVISQIIRGHFLNSTLEKNYAIFMNCDICPYILFEGQLWKKVLQPKDAATGPHFAGSKLIILGKICEANAMLDERLVPGGPSTREIF